MPSNTASRAARSHRLINEEARPSLLQHEAGASPIPAAVAQRRAEQMIAFESELLRRIRSARRTLYGARASLSVSQLLRQLATIARYERQSLSRRSQALEALEALDAAQARPSSGPESAHRRDNKADAVRSVSSPAAIRPPHAASRGQAYARSGEGGGVTTPITPRPKAAPTQQPNRSQLRPRQPSRDHRQSVATDASAERHRPHLCSSIEQPTLIPA